MEGIMIKPEELGALKDVKLAYGFTDRVMMQIYNFYKMHSQDEYYFLDLDGVQDLFAFYDRDYIDIYMLGLALLSIMKILIVQGRNF